MFICYTCALDYIIHYPVSESHGPCEVCGETGTGYNTPKATIAKDSNAIRTLKLTKHEVLPMSVTIIDQAGKFLNADQHRNEVLEEAALCLEYLIDNPKVYLSAREYVSAIRALKG